MLSAWSTVVANRSRCRIENKYSARLLFRHFRRTFGLTQRQLAIGLGITKRHVAYVEAGRKMASAKLMTRFKELVARHERERIRESGVSWWRKNCAREL